MERKYRELAIRINLTLEEWREAIETLRKHFNNPELVIEWETSEMKE